MDSLNILLKLVMLFLGSFGNILIFTIFSRKSLEKFASRDIYLCMAFFSWVSIIEFVVQDILNSFEIDILVVTNLACKVLKYIEFFSPTILAWLLVYISIDRFISIGNRSLKFTNKKWFQKFVILFTIIYNMIFYLPIIIYYKLQYKLEVASNLNSSVNKTFTCSSDKEYKLFIYIADLLNCSVVPFSLMILFSCLLIHTIFESRKRVIRLNSASGKKILKKDIKFAITSILLNISFVALNLPLTFTNLYYLITNEKCDPDLSDALNCIFYINSCDIFYTLFAFNSVFRQEIFVMLNIKSKYISKSYT